jgi:hypothetical protein
MHIVERLPMGPSDVGVMSSRHCSRRRSFICDVTAKLSVLNFWINFATIRAKSKNASKCSHLVSCDKQKMARVCFGTGVFFEWKYHASGFLGWETHLTAVGFPHWEHFEAFLLLARIVAKLIQKFKTESMIFPLKKHTRAYRGGCPNTFRHT